MVKLTTQENLVKNLRYLMRREDLSQSALSRKSGVSQKAISNILNPEVKQSPSIETIEKLARAFNLKGWHMIMPRLAEDCKNVVDFEQVYIDWLASNEKGRELIKMVAEREAAFNSKQHLAEI